VLLCFFVLAFVSYASAQCDSDCTGATDISCLYCPDACGTCASEGVITQCRLAGDVHLGLDDEPFANSNAVLDVLQQKSVNASFFIIGMNVAGNEGIIQRMLNEGHYVGDHSWTHSHFNTWNTSQLDMFASTELLATRQAIQTAAERNPPPAVDHYRPPYGELNNQVLQRVKDSGFVPIMWNMDLNDWMENATIISSLLSSTLTSSPASSSSFIMLYHAAAATSLGMLPQVIDSIRSAGYRFVSAQDCYLPPPTAASTGMAPSSSGSSGSGVGSTGTSQTVGNSTAAGGQSTGTSAGSSTGARSHAVSMYKYTQASAVLSLLVGFALALITIL